MIRPILAGLAAGLLVTGCTSTMGAHGTAHAYPEAAAYLVSDDAMGDVDVALARAASNDKRVLLVMGANWCHYSRALAGWPLAMRRSILPISDGSVREQTLTKQCRLTLSLQTKVRVPRAIGRVAAFARGTCGSPNQLLPQAAS